MAIYHLSIQIIGRAQGRSAVAAAAYRSGEQLHDERTGEDKFYHREVKPDTMILAPSNSPEWAQDRNRLWNEVEKAEVRKDAQLSREMNIALPRELSHEQQRELIRDFAQKEFVNKGMIADISIHRDDSNNPHAHVMLTMREVNEQGFGKKNRNWNADFANKKENSRGFVKKEKCLDIREQWANYANQALEKAQVNERITHLSHEARGIEQLPQIHLGHRANAMEKRGIETEKGDFNREVKRINAEIIDLNKEREAIKLRIQEQKQTLRLSPQEKTELAAAARYLKTNKVSLSKINDRLEALNRWENNLNKDETEITTKEKAFASAEYTMQTIERLEKETKETPRLERFSERYKFAKSSLKARKEDLLKQGFTVREDLDNKRAAFERLKDEKTTQISKERQSLKKERDCLNNATKALQNKVIRDVQADYPDWVGKEHLNYQSAAVIQDFNNRQGRIVPIDEILGKSNDLFERKKSLEKEIKPIVDRTKQLKTAKEYLEKYEKALEKVNSYNFFTKRSDKYKDDLKALELAKDLMEKIGGITDREDYQQQLQDHRLNEAHLPNLQKQAADLQPAINGVKGIFDVINTLTKQAEYENQKAQWQRQHTKTRKPGQKQKQQVRGYDYER